MELAIDAELRALCAEVAAWMADEPAWRECESSDMFQSAHYCGGFEADEDAFTFSHYDDAGRERWFTLTPEDVGRVLDGQLAAVATREPR